MICQKNVWNDGAGGREDMRGMLEKRETRGLDCGGVNPTPSPPLFSSGRASRDMKQRKTMGERQMSQSEIS